MNMKNLKKKVCTKNKNKNKNAGRTFSKFPTGRVRATQHFCFVLFCFVLVFFLAL